MLHFAQIFAFAFITGLSGALIPGPLLAFNIHSAAKRGPTAGFFVVIGHGIIEATIVVAIFAGASRFLQSQATLRVIAAVGAAALAVMGLGMLRQARGVSLAEVIASGDSPSRIEHPVVGGFLLSILNPTFPLWWATVGLALVTRYKPTPANIAVFYGGHISSDFAWYVFVACLVGFGRRHIPDRAYRAFVAVCAVALVGFGALFAYRALTGVGIDSPAPETAVGAASSAGVP